MSDLADVTILVTDKAYEKIKEAWNKYGFVPNYTSEATKNGIHLHLVEWFSVKWGTLYEDSRAILDVLKLCDALASGSMSYVLLEDRNDGSIDTRTNNPELVKLLGEILNPTTDDKSYEWIIAESNAELNSIYLDRFFGTEAEVKREILAMIEENASKNGDGGWVDCRTETIGEIEKDFAGNLSAFIAYKDNTINYAVQKINNIPVKRGEKEEM